MPDSRSRLAVVTGVLLILGGSALFYACNRTKTPVETQQLITYGRYWTGVGEFMNVVAIPQFKKESGLDIQMVSYNKTTETLERVEVETKAGKPTADFVWIDFMDINAYKSKDLLLDISDVINPIANQIPAKILDPCRGADGKIYAVPHQISIDLMVYNEKSIPLESLPRTYSELLDWCKQNPGRYSYRGTDEHLTTSLMNFFYAYGALKEGQEIAKFFDPAVNPAIVDAFNYLIELNKYTKKPLYTDYGTMELEMANELLWLFSIWDSNIVRIRSNKNAPYVRLHPGYNLEGPTGKKAICLGGWLFAVPKNAAHPDLGKKFVSWIMSKDMQIKSIGDSTHALCGHIPARIDATEEMPEFMKNWFDVKDVQSLRNSAFESLVIRPTWASYYFDFSTLLQRAHDEIVIQGKPTETVLKNIQSELDLIVESSSY